MHKVVNTTDKEKYEMYNSLEKDTLIGMLIECNRHLQRLTTTAVIIDNTCSIYLPSTSTSMRCVYCNKLKWEHP